MQLTGIIRIARDVEIRYLPDGTPVGNMAGVYSYGKKKQGEQYKPSQFIDITIWGKQATGLEQYLTKGTIVSVDLVDVHIEAFKKNDGSVSNKLVGRLRDIEFCGNGKSEPRTQEPKPVPPPSREVHNNQKANGYVPDDMDEDIPF